MFFSPSNKSFYDPQSSYPNDSIEISMETYRRLISGIESGMLVSADDKGMPLLLEQVIQPEDIISQAEAKRASLRATADSEISWRRYAVGKGIATDEEIKQLDEWELYRVMLMRLDLSKAAHIDWPDAP